MALKLRKRSLFPAVVTVSSPLLLVKEGLSYSFSFDTAALFANPNFTNITLSTAAFTGATSGATTLKANAVASGTVTLPAATDTLVGKATTDTLTNKTFDTAGSGNSLLINGVAATANAGTGAVVRATSPTITTPTITTPAISGALTVSSNASAALIVGPNGATNPVLSIDASVASQASGLSVKGNAAGGGTGIAVIDSASNSPLSINALGTGAITLGNTSTGNITVSRALNYGGVTLNNAVTGTGNMVLSTSPALTTPNLGTPSAVTLTNGTGLPTTGLTGTLQAAQEPAHTGDMTNTAGNLATTVTKINGVDQTTAWATYTPTITAQTGTITTSSASGRYKQIGKTVFLQIDVTITTAGTGAGGLQATLPLTAAANNYAGSSREIVVSGKSGGAIINSGSPTMADLRDATGTTYIANTARVIVGLTYELP